MLLLSAVLLTSNLSLAANVTVDLTNHVEKIYESEVKVTVGSKLNILLSGRSGTGYSWFVIPEDMTLTGSRRILKFVNSSY